MNALIQGYPRELEVNGVFYPIDADYRICLAIMDAFNDERGNIYEKQSLMVEMLFDEIPPDFEAAAKAAIDFLNLGDESLKVTHKKPIYSFSHDAKFIRSAFRSKGMSLDDIDFLHWWDFVYSFFDLKDTFFNELAGVRSRLQDGTATKEDRKYAKQNPEIVNLPTNTKAQPSEDSEFERRYRAAKEKQGR